MKKSIVILFIFLPLGSISAKNNYLRYGFDKKTAVFGDTVTMTWEAPKKYKVTISGFDSVFSNVGKIKFVPREKERMKIVATKGKKTIRRNTGLIKIVFPQLNYFIAQRDKDEPEKINIEWNTENYKNVSIERIGSNLPPKGKAAIFESDRIRLALTLENYNGEKLVRYAKVQKDFSQKREYIKGWTKLNESDSIPFYMEIISINVSNYPNEIEMKVLAYDTLGNFISGLAPPDISLEDAYQTFRKVIVKNEFGEKAINFKVREIGSLEKNNSDISFVMDYSGSMADVMERFKNISSYFVSNKSEKDRMSITIFDQRIYLLSELTSDTSKLLNAIKDNPYPMGGSTALYAACDQGLRSIWNNQSDKNLVVFTDGKENSSFPYYGHLATNANDLSNKIRKTKTKLYIVGFGNSVNYETLNELCSLSNGKFYYINNFEDLKKVLFEIDFQMKSYYAITFSPPRTQGLSDIKLVYRNMDSDRIVEDKYFIGTVGQIVEKENTLTTTTPADSVNIVSPPQVIANFKFNKAFLEDQFRIPLDQYARYLQQNPDVNIIVNGHSDSRGNEKVRERISQKRAETVAKYMEEKGIDPKRIETNYYSFSRPLHQIERQEWQARENRRVEIIMYKQN